MTRISKRLNLSQISGKTSFCDYHHVSSDLFPQSILVWTAIKTIEGPHPHQGLACFDESGLLFWGANTFPGSIWMYTGVPVVSNTWFMYPLEFLWSEVWKYYILLCNTQIEGSYATLSHLRIPEVLFAM